MLFTSTLSFILLYSSTSYLSFLTYSSFTYIDLSIPKYLTLPTTSFTHFTSNSCTHTLISVNVTIWVALVTNCTLDLLSPKFAKDVSAIDSLYISASLTLFHSFVISFLHSRIFPLSLASVLASFLNSNL